MKSETLARLMVGLFIITAIFIPLAGVMLSRNRSSDIELHARMPESGGWSQDTIQAEVGKPLRLHITSDDVVHGFAIGKSDQPFLDISPGEFVDTQLTFDRPGRYTFFCSRWCGPNHWRMHGIIEVTGGGEPVLAEELPLYLQLDIDIDAPHQAKVIPNTNPSAEHGAEYAALLPTYAISRQVYLTTSPADLWLRLRDEPQLSGLSDGDLWDVIRWLWERQTNPDSIGLGVKLFVALAAAAHGETGKGDGVMVRGLPSLDHADMGKGLVRPPDFTDPHTLLGASPALLEGKIIRGGMGTGMPSWGAILTDEQIDSIVGYLYTIAWEAIGDTPLFAPRVNH